MRKTIVLILLLIAGISALLQGDVDGSITIEANNDKTNKEEANQALEHCIRTAKSFLNAHHLQEIKGVTFKTLLNSGVDDIQSGDINDDMNFWQIKILNKAKVVDQLGVGILKDIEGNDDEIKNYLGETFLKIIKAKSNNSKHFIHNATQLFLEPYPVYYSIYLKAFILSLIVGIALIPLIGRLSNMIWKKNWMSSDSKICNVLNCFDPIKNMKSLIPKSYFKETPFDFLNGYRFTFIITGIPYHLNTRTYPLLNYQNKPAGFFPQLLKEYTHNVNNLGNMFMITGFLISYLTLSRNYPSGKPINYISNIFKRICRLLVPALGFRYFWQIADYFATNLLFIQALSHPMGKCAPSFLYLKFFQSCNFHFWYVRSDVYFGITGFLFLGIYLKKSQNSFLGDNRKKFYLIGLAMCVLANLCLAVMSIYEYDLYLLRIRFIMHYSPFLIGLMGGALYFEYICEKKIDEFKNSVGYTLFNSIKTSKKLSTALIACSFITIMIIRIDNTYLASSKLFPYSIASLILMCGALVGTLDIYNKIYGHWILEFLNNFTLEFYLGHAWILQYYSFATNVSYENTQLTYFYTIGIMIVYSTILAMIFKLGFSIPLGALIDLAFASGKNQVAQQVNAQDSVSNQNQVEGSQYLIERSSQNVHEKQD